MDTLIRKNVSPVDLQELKETLFVAIATVDLSSMDLFCPNETAMLADMAAMLNRFNEQSLEEKGMEDVIEIEMTKREADNLYRIQRILEEKETPYSDTQ